MKKVIVTFYIITEFRIIFQIELINLRIMKKNQLLDKNAQLHLFKCLFV